MSSVGIEQLPIERLQTDERYQRESAARRVKTMAAQYDPTLANVIVVSRRKDGSLWVIDGLHRTAAARLAGRTHMVAAVYEGLDPKDEARMFDLINKLRSPVKATSRFRARVMYGDPQAVRIDRLLKELGSGVQSSGANRNAISAISAIERIVDRYGWSALKSTLEVIHEANDGVLTSRTAPANVLLGVASLLKDSPHLRRSVVAVLKANDAAELGRMASKVSQAEGIYAPLALRQALMMQIKKRSQAPDMVLT